MKSLKSILAAIAFVFAFSAAFAISNNNYLALDPHGDNMGTCQSQALNESKCGLTDKSFGQCTVTFGPIIVDAFDGGCVTPIYKQTSTGH